MTDIEFLLPFVYSIHGYATARNNNTLKFWCIPLMAFLLLFDVFTVESKGYADTFNIPAWQFLLIAIFVIMILAGFWLIGYGIGKLQREKT